jgi:hypothetical protein
MADVGTPKNKARFTVEYIARISWLHFLSFSYFFPNSELSLFLHFRQLWGKIINVVFPTAAWSVPWKDLIVRTSFMRNVFIRTYVMFLWILAFFLQILVGKCH